MFLVNKPWYKHASTRVYPCRSYKFSKPSSLMSNQPTTTDYLRQATHFISYATLLHLRHYGSAFMAPSQKNRVHWTDDEISALVDYLHSHRSEAEGGLFKKQTYQGAVLHLQPFHRQGGLKDVNSVKEKFTKVSDKILKCRHNFTSY
jgi:hypothetical protein